MKNKLELCDAEHIFIDKNIHLSQRKLVCVYEVFV